MSTWEELYDKILKNGPSQGTLLIVLSKLKEEGQLKRVIQECRHALKVYPNNAHIRMILAETYLEAGLSSRAETVFDEVTGLIDSLTPAYKRRGEILMRAGRNQEARSAFEIYLAHHPEDQETLQIYDRLEIDETPAIIEPSPPEEALAPAEPLKEEVPLPEEEDVAAIATPTIAEVYFNQGLIHEAIDTYEMVIEKNPEDEDSRKRLQELRTMLDTDSDAKERAVGEIRAKKEKVIATLEAWLAKLQEKAQTVSVA